jgi:hypothetical protein
MRCSDGLVARRRASNPSRLRLRQQAASGSDDGSGERDDGSGERDSGERDSGERDSGERDDGSDRDEVGLVEARPKCERPTVITVGLSLEAGYGVRTRDFQLGKLALYQLS